MGILSNLFGNLNTDAVTYEGMKTRTNRLKKGKTKVRRNDNRRQTICYKKTMC
jgi:hypothetical protein